MGIHGAKGSSSVSSQQATNVPQPAREPGHRGHPAWMCAGSLLGTGTGGRQRYQLELNWKGLKVKPTQGMIHGVPRSTETGREGGKEQLGKCCQESLCGFAPFPLCSCLTIFEPLLVIHHLLCFPKESGRTTLNCSSFHQ